ncbi:type 4a pilus biogenesis protein PilO [Deinococcus sp. 6GRE01]|uniref:type 4a pilus biogenesis protein PilO n=1 Tax=Deinococcus sp. 6GRE01 TaxID=2745873 RepID=UPI001E310B81|nr:type 4a pilus biogenesis protein PilO [Deinococcus sp. 6GRE01]MCD0156058.1 type 4a pilus biogenesis protein PilO [Deinococcus sp. 6GRE01]
MNQKALLPAVAVSLLGVLGVVKWSWPMVQTARAEQTRLQSEIDRLTADAAALPAEQVRAAELSRADAELQQSLPDSEELPRVLDTLQLAAQRLGITTGKLSRTVRVSDIAGVNAVDLDLDISGTYARTQAYVQTIAALPRAFTARGISLSAGDDGQVTGSLKLTTYTRDSTPVKAPTPTTPTAIPNGATP